MKAIGILWNSLNKYTSLVLDDISSYAKINGVIKINFKEKYSDFISAIYPYKGNQLWKLEYKIAHMDNQYESNEIKILFLDIQTTSKQFIERKNQYIYLEVENLKRLIRNKYKDIVDSYAFDNVFHMTDDEEEYYETLELISNYICNYFSEIMEIFNCDDIYYLEPINSEIKEGKRRKYNLFDGRLIFKEKKENSFENLCEVFCCQFLYLLNIDCAKYYFAKYKDSEGVITKNFIEANESYISGTQIIDAYLNYKETGTFIIKSYISHDIKDITKYNNLDDLKTIFNVMSLVYGKSYDDIIIALKKLIAIDMILMQSDRNSNNWGILCSKSICKVRLCPTFDNSNIFNFNKPLIINQMRMVIDNEGLLYLLALEHNPTLLQIHRNENIFLPKNELYAKIDDDDILCYLKSYIDLIDNNNLENIVNNIVERFPLNLQNQYFSAIIKKLLHANIEAIKDTNFKSKKKLLV